MKLLSLIVLLGLLNATSSFVENDLENNLLTEELPAYKKEKSLTDIEDLSVSVPNNDKQDITFEDDIKATPLEESLTSKFNAENVTESEKNKSKLSVVTCSPRLAEEHPAVKIVNNSELLSIIVPESNITANECVLVLFYAPWCYFSAAASPHYNALARVFPTVHVLAVNAIKYNNFFIFHSSLNTRYGVVAVPTLLFFHNGRPICKYNETSYTLEKLVTYVNKHTGLAPFGTVNVTSADFEGPLPSEVVQETDYIFWISCAFILMCCGLGFAKSSLCHYILESIHSNWQEAEAQHEHAD